MVITTGSNPISRLIASYDDDPLSSLMATLDGVNLSTPVTSPTSPTSPSQFHQRQMSPQLQLQQEQQQQQQQGQQRRQSQVQPTFVQQANVRRDHDMAILAAIEILMELPKTPPSADSAFPSSDDIAILKSRIEILQPKDFDDMVEERNIDHKCGYALCPRPHQRGSRSGHYRILTSSRGKGRVVETQMLDKYCSEDCARRSLYVRVQLDDEPSWMRAAKAPSEIHLLGEQTSNPYLDYTQTETGKQDAEMVKEQLQKIGIQGMDISIDDTLKPQEEFDDDTMMLF